MPFVAKPLPVRFSDLVVKEIDPASAYSRDCINVTPPRGASAPLLIGNVVFRAKSLDPAAAYAVLSDVSQLVDTNEFAVVFGDEYSFNPSFVPKAIAAGKFNAIAFIRGMVQLKDYYVKENNIAMTAAQLATLSTLLKRQGVILVETKGSIA